MPVERGPRARMRKTPLLATAMGLMEEGLIPSASEVAEAAEVSRATAYRYFPSEAAMIEAAVEEALGPILGWTSDFARRRRAHLGTAHLRLSAHGEIRGDAARRAVAGARPLGAPAVEDDQRRRTLRARPPQGAARQGGGAAPRPALSASN